jgi:hypothetical protein
MTRKKSILPPVSLHTFSDLWYLTIHFENKKKEQSCLLFVRMLLGSHYIAWADLELEILLPQPLKC